MVPHYDFEGGEIILNGINKKFEMKCNQNQVAFIYFNVDKLHRVEPVIKGYRFSIVFHVLKTKLYDPDDSCKINVDFPEKNVDILSDVGIFCDHYKNFNNILLPVCSLELHIINKILEKFDYIDVSYEDPKTVYDIYVDHDAFFELEESYSNSVIQLLESKGIEKYTVEHILGNNHQFAEEEMYYKYGYTGNSPFSGTFTVTICHGYLLNPK